MCRVTDDAFVVVAAVATADATAAVVIGTTIMHAADLSENTHQTHLRQYLRIGPIFCEETIYFYILSQSRPTR